MAKQTVSARPAVLIFISHSERDKEQAKALVELLRIALMLRSQDIMCTSEPSSGICPGGWIPEQALEAAKCAAVFIILVTRNSVNSQYVLCELGARLGDRKKVHPILAGVGSNSLPGPIAESKAIHGHDGTDVHRLVEDVRGVLGKRKEPASSYQQYVDDLVKLCKDLHQAEDKVWAFDGSRYLIVCPRRPGLDRPYPVINSEDVMALTLIKDFLAEHGAKTELRVVTYPQIAKDQNYCAEQQKLIEKHNGHVVYVCFNSMPSEEWEYLAKLNFPFTFQRDDQGRPFFRRQRGDSNLTSPVDAKIPQPEDFALVAKFRRANKKTNGYIVAGLHGIGTWAAAKFLVTHSDIDMLASNRGDKPFCVMLNAKLDPRTYEITHCAMESAMMGFLETPPADL